MIRGQVGQDFSTQPQPQSQVVKPDFRVQINNPKALKAQWDTYKAINIPNLLPTHVAEEVWDYYYNQPTNWWDLIVWPDPNHDYSNDEEYHMYRTKNDDPTLPERLNYIRELNNQGRFSYTYNRKDKEFHPHLSLFQSPEFLKVLEFITGHENLIAPLASTFVSNYGPGHYNGPHSDGPNGRIAFVYHLSKDWRPEYGGVFMRMDDAYTPINKAVTPKFNTLSMFDVSKNGGAPHLVTEVVEGVNNRRISYTGWYK